MMLNIRKGRAVFINPVYESTEHIACRCLVISTGELCVFIVVGREEDRQNNTTN